MNHPTHAAIASESPYTVRAGARIAELGGNAVDIAVGAALAATVSEALMCSLAGSAFVAIKVPGQPPELIDGEDAVPRAVHDASRRKAARLRQARVAYGDGITVNVGHASVAVPGMLRALELAWKRHGGLPWSEVLAPAIDLARTGTTANQTLVKWLALAGRAIFFEQQESRRSFFPDGEHPVGEGEFFKMPHMDDSLERIARQGADALYRGELGRALEQEIVSHGGFVTLEDLSAYEAKVRVPLVLSSRGYQLALNPPPSIGGAMVGSMVQMMDASWSERWSEAERVAAIARIQRAMFSLRREEAGATWNAERASRILEKEWLLEYLGRRTSPNTMHLSVATGEGSVVAITMSNGYGSGVSIPGTGIATNNSLGEPEMNPQGFFRIAAGERLVSNMSPTVAWHEGGTTLAMGSPGASRIATTVFQGWVRFAFEGMTFEDMVRAPRLHVEEVDGRFTVQHEPGIDVREASESFAVRPFDAPDMYFGALNIAGTDAEHRLHAYADNRRHGARFVSREE